MPEGQYHCIITPVVKECQELPNPEHRSHRIEFQIDFMFAGYLFYDKVDSFELAYQMKFDMEKRFKTLRDYE